MCTHCIPLIENRTLRESCLADLVLSGHRLTSRLLRGASRRTTNTVVGVMATRNEHQPEDAVSSCGAPTGLDSGDPR